MPTSLTRIVALLLIPCFLADPAMASVPPLPAQPIIGTQTHRQIECEALSVRAGAFFHGISARAAIVVVTLLLSHGAWISALAQRTGPTTPAGSGLVVPAQITPPRPTLEDAKRTILNLLHSQDFKNRLRALARNRRLPKAVAENEKDLTEALGRFISLFENNRVYELRENAGPGLNVSWEDQTAGVTPVLINDPHLLAAAIWHEVLHLTSGQQRISKRFSATIDALNQIARRGLDDLESNPKYKSLVISALKDRAAMELPAWYGGLAWCDSEAESDGYAHVQEALHARLKPYADAVNKSVDEYVEYVYSGKSGQGSIPRAWATYYPFAKAYRRGGIDRGFADTFIRSIVLEDPDFAVDLKDLSRLPPNEGGLKPGQDYVEWIRNLILPEAYAKAQTPESKPLVQKSAPRPPIGERGFFTLADGPGRSRVNRSNPLEGRWRGVRMERGGRHGLGAIQDAHGIEDGQSKSRQSGAINNPSVQKIADSITEAGLLNLYGSFAPGPPFSPSTRDYWEPKGVRFGNQNTGSDQGYRSFLTVNQELNSQAFINGVLMPVDSLANILGGPTRGPGAWGKLLITFNQPIVVEEQKMEKVPTTVTRPTWLSRLLESVRLPYRWTSTFERTVQTTTDRVVKSTRIDMRHQSTMREYASRNPLLMAKLKNRPELLEEKAVSIQFWGRAGDRSGDYYLTVILPESIGRSLAELLLTDPRHIETLVAQYYPEYRQLDSRAIGDKVVSYVLTPEKADRLAAEYPTDKNLRNFVFLASAREELRVFEQLGVGGDLARAYAEKLFEIKEIAVPEFGKKVPAKQTTPRPPTGHRGRTTVEDGLRQERLNTGNSLEGRWRGMRETRRRLHGPGAMRHARGHSDGQDNSRGPSVNDKTSAGTKLSTLRKVADGIVKNSMKVYGMTATEIDEDLRTLSQLPDAIFWQRFDRFMAIRTGVFLIRIVSLFAAGKFFYIFLFQHMRPGEVAFLAGLPVGVVATSLLHEAGHAVGALVNRGRIIFSGRHWYEHLTSVIVDVPADLSPERTQIINLGGPLMNFAIGLIGLSLLESGIIINLVPFVQVVAVIMASLSLMIPINNLNVSVKRRLDGYYVLDAALEALMAMEVPETPSGPHWRGRKILKRLALNIRSRWPFRSNSLRAVLAAA